MRRAPPSASRSTARERQDRPVQQATHAPSAGGAPGVIRWGLPSWIARRRGDSLTIRRRVRGGQMADGSAETDVRRHTRVEVGARRVPSTRPSLGADALLLRQRRDPSGHHGPPERITEYVLRRGAQHRALPMHQQPGGDGGNRRRHVRATGVCHAGVGSAARVTTPRTNAATRSGAVRGSMCPAPSTHSRCTAGSCARRPSPCSLGESTRSFVP